MAVKPVREENGMTLWQAEMGMIRWLCGAELTSRLIYSELRKISLQCYGKVD